jgi:hypothetical protein
LPSFFAEGAEPEDIKQAFMDGDLSADETKSIATAMEKLTICAIGWQNSKRCCSGN